MEILKFSRDDLQRAQQKIKSKKCFKVNKNNYKEYENFVINSYEGITSNNERRIEDEDNR